MTYVFELSTRMACVTFSPSFLVRKSGKVMSSVSVFTDLGRFYGQRTERKESGDIFLVKKRKKNSSNALRNAYDLALRFRELESVNGPRGAYCNAPSSTKKMFTLLWRRVTLTVIIVLYYCFSILYTLPLYRAARIMSRLQTVSGRMPAGYDDVCRWRFPARFHCVALSAAPAHRRKQYYYYYSRRSSCVWRLNSPMERAERIVTTQRCAPIRKMCVIV